MKTNRHLRSLAVASFTLAVVVLPDRAQATFTFTLQEVGTGVTISGSGSLNTAGLGGFNPSANPASGFQADSATLIANGGGNFSFSLPAGAGPTSFGTNDTAYFPTTTTGDSVGISGGRLLVPGDYVSGSALANFSTFDSQTLATLGFTPGTYTYTLPSNDTLVVTGFADVVPEPSTWAFVGAGTLGLGVSLRGRRRAARLA